MDKKVALLLADVAGDQMSAETMPMQNASGSGALPLRLWMKNKKGEIFHDQAQ